MHTSIDPTTQTQTLYIPFASPPTPCPSPILQIQDSHATLSPARRHYLSAFLHSCTPAELIFISNIVAPLLKRDFLAALPTELAVHILAFIDDPCTLVRAGLVSRGWRRLAADEWLWRRMCDVWEFELEEGDLDGAIGVDGEEEPLEEMEQYAELTMDPALEWLTARKRKARRVRLAGVIPPPSSSSSSSLDPPRLSYKDYFKESYITMMNWRYGGHLLRSHRLPSLSSTSAIERTSLHPGPQSHQSTINPPLPSLSLPYLHPHLSNNPNTHTNTTAPTPTATPLPADTGVVTSLALDTDWVVVGLAGSRIHVFSARTGVLARTLVGHEAGVWGVCLVSRSGGRKSSNTNPGSGSRDREKMKKGNEQEKFVEAFNAIDLTSDAHHSTSSPISSQSPPIRSRIPAAASSKPNISSDGFITVTGKKGNKPKGSGKGKVPERAHGVLPGVAAGIGGQGALDHLVPASLRIALGLRPEVDEGVEDEREREEDEEEMDIQEREQEEHQGVWGRGVVDEDAEDEERLNDTVSHPAPQVYVPCRQSDPCYASEGWGQPNALVVSGGCDKVVRVWDVKSGHCIYTLLGHTSTIRCMRVLHGRPIAVTGSRDGTVRVWDVQRGRAVRCLRGHEGSVRCLDVNGKRAVSGSYDKTCRMWNIDTGECIHTLRGHFSQIYSVAFDGVRVASGGLDTTVRIWDAETGHCIAVLHGHTALVCQLQLSPNYSILATGGSDGRVITFSLSTFLPVHRLAAHDSSVTALQFDKRFLVTGGNDGRVRLFETGSGKYVRELSEEGEIVWKVGYAGGTCAVMGKRAGKTVMEIWSFRPREEGERVKVVMSEL